MQFIYLLSLLFICSYDVQAEDPCTLTGVVTDPAGHPLAGTTVLISGTSTGAMTDTSGTYLIYEVSPQALTLEARMTGMIPDTAFVTPSPGDTTRTNFVLEPEPVDYRGTAIFHSMEDQLTGTEFTDTLEIVIDNWQDLDTEHCQAWRQEELLPGWQKNDSTFCVALPEHADTLHFSAYPAREVTLPVSRTTKAVRTICPVDRGATAPDNSTFIDLTEWGNCRYENWGLLGSDLSYTDGSQPRLLLVYHEQAVLIDSTGIPVVVEFPFPTRQYICDTELKYVLIWEIFGQNGTSGDLACISLEDGSSSVFDPTPDIDESEAHYMPRFCSESDRAPGFTEARYLISSSGAVTALGDDRFRTFERDGTLMFDTSLEELGIENCYFTDYFLSLNETAASAIFTDVYTNYCTTITLRGDILNLCTLPDELPEIGTLRESMPLPDSASIWKAVGQNGIVRVNCLTGECTDQQGIRAMTLFPASDEDRFCARNTGNNDLYSVMLETRDMETGELLSSFQEPFPYPAAAFPAISSMSNGGFFLGTLTPRPDQNDYKYAFILNESGETVWKSPPLHRTALYGNNLVHIRELHYPPVSLSPDGRTAVLSHGRYLIIVHFDESMFHQTDQHSDRALRIR